MGQYYKLVNPVKRQFLDPHNFGAGLKLMEFTNTNFGPQQALCILLAHANGRGGGDLEDRNLTEDEKAMIGSWAGDPIYVAGDYDDPWFGIPDDLKGRNYTIEKYNYANPLKKIKHKCVFGQRRNKETGLPEEHGETLYSAAEYFFEDISDKMIGIIAKGEAGQHPFAAVDLASKGVRHVPQWGVLPDKEPRQPAGGRKLYKEYKKYAVTPLKNFTNEVAGFIRRHPAQADAIIAAIKEAVDEAKNK